MGGAGRAGGIGLRMKLHGSQYPLRPRGTLELFDVSIKLCKKSFGPLIGVSALVWLGMGVIYFFLVELRIINTIKNITHVYLFALLLLFLLFPALYGAVGCCIEVALAGQHVTFQDCIKFARVRYKVLLIAQCIAVILAVILGIVIFGGAVFLMGILTNFEKSISSITANAATIGYILLIICCLVAGLYILASLAIMPLIACLEYDSLNVKELIKRSFGLTWNRIKTSIILALTHSVEGVLLLMLAINITKYVTNLAVLQESMPAFALRSFLPFMLISDSLLILIGMLWTPFCLMSLGAFYIDTRIRKEGFDLEYQLSHSDQD